MFFTDKKATYINHGFFRTTLKARKGFEWQDNLLLSINDMFLLTIARTEFITATLIMTSEVIRWSDRLLEFTYNLDIQKLVYVSAVKVIK